MCALNEKHPAGVEVHNYAGAAEAEIDQIAHKHARHIIAMDDIALVRLEFLKFGELGDVVVFRTHHAIVDGFGLTLLMEDLIKLVLQLPILGSALTYAGYFQGWGRDAETTSAETEKYWQAKLWPPPTPPNLGRVKRGLDLLIDGRTWKTAKDLEFVLQPEQAQQLKERAQLEGVSLFLLLNAAFLKSVAKIGSSEDVLYSVTLGRSDWRLSNYAGHHTLHPLMRQHSISAKSLGEVAQDTLEELRSTIQNLPAPAGRRSGAWDQRIIKSGGYPRQITTGIQSPAGRLKSSPFAELFSLGAGRSLKVGNMELNRSAMPPEAGDIDELAFRPNFEAGTGVVKFKYDAQAFEDTEIEELAADTFSRLGLRVQKSRLIHD